VIFCLSFSLEVGKFSYIRIDIETKGADLSIGTGWEGYLEVRGVDFEKKEKRDTLELRIVYRNEDIFALLGVDKKRIRIRIPPSSPVELRIDMELGKLKLKLDKYMLENLYLCLRNGRGTIEFEGENRICMKHLELTVSLGKIILEDMGNANVAKWEINSGVANILLDFGGNWRGGEKINLFSTMSVIKIKRGEFVPILSKKGIFNFGTLHGGEGIALVELMIDGAANIIKEER